MFRRAAETRAHGVPGPAARQVGHPAPPDRPGHTSPSRRRGKPNGRVRTARGRERLRRRGL